MSLVWVRREFGWVSRVCFGLGESLFWVRQEFGLC